jgi:cystathionine gamma-lyase
MKIDDPKLQFETLAIHAGQEPDPSTGAIMTPIFQTSTYVQAGVGNHKGYEYSRTGNPTRHALEANLAALEGAKHGLAFSSGCGAATTLLHLFDAGDHVVSSDDVYGGTYRLFTQVFSRSGLSFDFVDMTRIDQVAAAITPNTKLVWIETPTNPLLKLVDIQAVAELGHRVGAMVVVDNTFMSPYFQRPLELGADVVLHSTTKFLNGHSDVVGGAIVTNDASIHQRLAYLQNAIGAVPGPMDAWLVMRGIKTLHLRMERHEQNAKRIAGYLVEHPRVERVIYPGLPSHPQHALAKKQMRGFGGMISVVLKADLEQARKFVASTRLFALAESLGGVESLIEVPAAMTHASVPPDVRRKIGIADGLIRLSCGVENADDLIADLEHAFAQI